MALNRRPKVLRPWLIKTLRETANALERAIDQRSEQSFEPFGPSTAGAPSGAEGLSRQGPTVASLGPPESGSAFAISDKPPVEWLRYVQARSALPDGSGAYASKAAPAGPPSGLQGAIAATRKWSQVLLGKASRAVTVEQPAHLPQRGLGGLQPRVATNTPPAPSHPTPSHPTPSHPTPSHPTPSHPAPSHPTASPAHTRVTSVQSSAAPWVDSNATQERVQAMDSAAAVFVDNPRGPGAAAERLAAKKGALPLYAPPLSPSLPHQGSTKLSIRRSWFTHATPSQDAALPAESSARRPSAQGAQTSASTAVGAGQLHSAPSRSEPALPSAREAQSEPAPLPRRGPLFRQEGLNDDNVQASQHRDSRLRSPEVRSAPFSPGRRWAPHRDSETWAHAQKAEDLPGSPVVPAPETLFPAREQRLEPEIRATRGTRFEQLLARESESTLPDADDRWPALPVRSVDSAAERLPFDWDRQLLEEQTAC